MMQLSRFGLTTVCLLLSVGAWAQGVEKVEATGQAAILDGDTAAARDKAIDDGLRKAVESSVGTMISSETITENYQLLSDKIYSQAEGYVRKYQVIDEKEEDGVFIVQISAEVATGAVSKDLDGLKVLMQRKGMPRALIMVAEQNIGDERATYWWGNQVGGPVAIQLNTVENTLMESLQEKGFTFVDPEIFSGKKSIAMPVATVSDKQAMRVAKVTDAEIIVVGSAFAKDIGATVEGNRMRSAHAEISVRVINTDNGKVIAIANAKGASMHIDSKMAGTMALRNCSKSLADDLTGKITKVWAAETSGVNSIRMTVTGFKNRKQLTDFISVLRNRVRSVKDVKEREMQSGRAILDVDLAGETRAMATELEAKDFGGAVKIEVTELKPNAITVKLLP